MSNTQNIGNQGASPSTGVNTINGVMPVANNIDLIDEGGNGAITITAPGSAGAGTVGVSVNVDGTTIVITGTAPNDVLSVANTTFWTWTVPNATGVNSDAVVVTQNVPLTAGTVYKFEAEFVGSDATQTHFAGGKQQCIAFRAGAGAATITPLQNQYLDRFPSPSPSGELDIQFAASGNNIVLTAFGSAAASTDWKAKVTFIAIP